MQVTAGWRDIFVSIALLLATPAAAQTIGVAETVRNDVVQVRAGANAPIAPGESVVRNEVVRTGAESATKLVFRDDTNVAVGPSATVTLDRFVFSGDDGSASKVSVNLVRGAFRFTTGGSDKKAYEIKTPLATIGVRGTVFDVLSVNAQTVVVLLEGALTGCTKGGQCRSISNPGDTLIITASGIRVTTTPGGPGGFTFAAFCGSDGVCTPTRYASTPAGGQFAGGLCGR